MDGKSGEDKVKPASTIKSMTETKTADEKKVDAEATMSHPGPSDMTDKISK